MMSGESIFINGNGETSRDFCYVANVVQANLLAATTQNTAAINQVYNVAVGDRTTLNELYGLLRNALVHKFTHLQDAKPEYRDFRTGDIAHSQADIQKAIDLLQYMPAYSIEKGLAVTIPSYFDK